MKTITCLVNEMSKLRWGWRIRLQHWRLTWLYLRSTLTKSDALFIMSDCEHVAGVYGLEWLSVDDVLEMARALWGDRPELEQFAIDAAARVSQKWSGDGNLVGAAQDWAIDLVKEYAEREGVDLDEVREEEAA